MENRLPQGLAALSCAQQQGIGSAGSTVLLTTQQVAQGSACVLQRQKHPGPAEQQWPTPVKSQRGWGKGGDATSARWMCPVLLGLTRPTHKTHMGHACNKLQSLVLCFPNSCSPGCLLLLGWLACLAPVHEDIMVCVPLLLPSVGVLNVHCEHWDTFVEDHWVYGVFYPVFRPLRGSCCCRCRSHACF